LFHEPSLHIYAVTHYFDPADELGCRWDDPDLAIPWPERPRLVSERDEAAGTYAELCAVVSRS
jgi:dTDP-4-dehydrorhamnose 3,5-epimerase